MKLLEETKKYVDSLFEPGQIPHFERALYWVMTLRPNASLAIQIAAYAHDIGRSNKKFYVLVKEEGFDAANEYHQVEGENMMKKFLSQHTDDKELINTVGFLIRHHEDGGTKDSDLVKDADSLSYFDTNSEKMLKNIDF